MFHPLGVRVWYIDVCPQGGSDRMAPGEGGKKKRNQGQTLNWKVIRGEQQWGGGGDAQKTLP